MKTLRWKSRYLTGTTAIDKNNRELVDCLNGFIQATKQREHCQEIDKLLEDLVAQLENFLTTEPTMTNLTTHIRTALINSLPMPTWDTPSCRKCDICDLAQSKIAQHIQASSQCLGITVQ